MGGAKYNLWIYSISIHPRIYMTPSKKFQENRTHYSYRIEGAYTIQPLNHIFVHMFSAYIKKLKSKCVCTEIISRYISTNYKI